MTSRVKMLMITMAIAFNCAAGDTYRNSSLEGPRVKGIFGEDHRRPARWNSTKFRPVVRLLRANGSFLCSGVMVGPSIVLGAAHCAFRNGDYKHWRERPVFVETWNKNRFKVVRWCVSPEFEGYLIEGQSAFSDITPDLVLMEVDGDIGEETGWAGVSRELKSGTKVTLAAFHGDAPGMLQIESCRVDVYDSWLYTDRVDHMCSVVSGASGGALLVFRGGRPYVVGIQVGFGDGVNHASFLGGHEEIRRWMAEAVEERPSGVSKLSNAGRSAGGSLARL